MATLDKVSWHDGADGFPPGLPVENAATHIGFFVTWAIRNDQWSDFLGTDASAGIEAVRRGQLSGGQFLLRECDGALVTVLFKPEFIPFAEPYYKSQYLSDYHKTLTTGLTSEYLVEDTEANYRIIASVIDDRYRAWRDGKMRPW
jgi:hypothetical protein